MQEHIPSDYQATAGAGGQHSLHLSSAASPSAASFHYSFEVIRPNLFRTTFSSDTHPLPPYPSVKKPQIDLKGVQVARQDGPSNTILTVNDVEVQIDLSPPCPVVSLGYRGHIPLHQDLPHRSYAVDGTGVSHYTRYAKNTLHVGLGEKAAPLNLSNRQFTLSATDSFGYDIYRTDPMYKHIPLLINATPNGCVAMFSTTHARGSYSIGSEMDGLWGPYKVYRQDHGGLEEYLLIGHTLQEIVTTYADLVGYPRPVPRWAFGYLAGGMKYSMLDDPPAYQALTGFADKLKHHDIPCSGFQLSSGYTVSESPPQTRNVFTWNKNRFPDPKGWIDDYHRRGIRLIANVKPYLLANHPEYAKLAAAGAFFKDPSSTGSATARLWSAGGGESGIGGHIDFTSRAGWEWWYNGIQELSRLGIDCMWNDNNEYVINDDTWQCKLDNPVLNSMTSTSTSQVPNESIGLLGRALQTDLHAQCSTAALLSLRPTHRPFVLTRSATAGTMRHASSTWSGDNVTSWAGLRGSVSLSINAGFTLLHAYGHDIGGFEGPQPSPELLLRWIQVGVYSARFAINCYKTTPADNSVGDVIEPWMYPAILPHVRKAIKRRYEMLPWLYSMHLCSCLHAEPPIRWVGWGYEADPEVWTNPTCLAGEEQYWLGDAVVVGVPGEGDASARMYLPRRESTDPGFLNMNAPYQHFAAGQWVDVACDWKTQGVPLLARVGCAIPVGRDVQVLAAGETEKDNVANLPRDDWRGVEIYPPPQASGDGNVKRQEGRWFESTWYEDDGISAELRVAAYTLWYRVCAGGERIEVVFKRDERRGFKSLWRELDVILPVGEGRPVVNGEDAMVVDGLVVDALGRDEQGRLRYRMREGVVGAKKWGNSRDREHSRARKNVVARREVMHVMGSKL